jgi:hypothetical protein
MQWSRFLSPFFQFVVRHRTDLDGRTVRVEPALGHKFNGDERGGYWPYGAAATSATENVGPATHGNPDKPPFQVTRPCTLLR